MCSKCKVITVSIEWYDLEAVVTCVPLWILLLLAAAALAPPQLVHPVATGAGRRRRAGSGSSRNRRSGDEDLARVNCGRCWWWVSVAGRSLDGRFVVSPQDAHTRGLLLGLLGLLLSQHLLLHEQLEILLKQRQTKMWWEDTFLSRSLLLDFFFLLKGWKSDWGEEWRVV